MLIISTKEEVMRWGRFVSVILCAISLKLGGVTGPTDRKNWLTFGGDMVQDIVWIPDHDSTSLTIVE